MVIGAGTVLTESQVELTKNAGGKFIISPDTNPEIIKKTRELGLVSIPGALTPSEATLANRSGADFVKLFPNGEVKPTYLKALVAPLSHIKFLAVGGVSAANAKETLAMGAVGIGVATAIANKDLIKKGDYEGITRLARDFVNAVKG
jgi:2-dehydro-3-deoxyphosphogluconate aldolase/(4S)-4-hydroxy-2-oxoglutarate aldolase